MGPLSQILRFFIPSLESWRIHSKVSFEKPLPESKGGWSALICVDGVVDAVAGL